MKPYVYLTSIGRHTLSENVSAHAQRISAEITHVAYYAVQGHSRSTILVPT